MRPTSSVHYCNYTGIIRPTDETIVYSSLSINAFLGLVTRAIFLKIILKEITSF